MFRNPTNKNYLEAQTLIGVDYLNGNGIAQDYAKALEWFEKAAGEDYPPAQNMLGAMFKNGHGVQQDYEQDYEQAFEWFEKAAIQDYDEGQTNLALMYVGGVSNLENYTKGFIWMEKAAKQGHAIAQYFMGEMFKDKDFVDEPSSIEAFEWYQRAANQGLPDAQACIAEMYKQGEGISQDDTKAFEWYQKAADQGHVETPEWFQKLLAEKDEAISSRTEQIENPNRSNELTIPFREFFDSYFRDESKRVPQSPGGGVLFFESMSSDEMSKFGDKAYDIRQKSNYKADILNADFMIDTSLVVKNYGTGLFLHLYEHTYRLHLKNYAQEWKIVDDIKSSYYDKADKVLIINGYKVSLISKSSCLYGERLSECINAYLEQNNEQKIDHEIVSNSALITDALDNIDNRLAEIEEKLVSLQYNAAA